MEDIAIVLLAGGQSYRYRSTLESGLSYHSDKLLSKKDNGSLLEYVVNELKPLGKIYIITRGEKRKKQYSALFSGAISNQSVNVITEESENAIGPLGGIYIALKHLRTTKTKIFLPADLPNIKKQVVGRFISFVLQSSNFDLVGLVHQNGQTENLVLAVQCNELLKTSRLLIKAKIYRVSSLFRYISNKRFVNSSNLVANTKIQKFFTDLDVNHSISKNTKNNQNIIDHTPLIHLSTVDFTLNKKNEIDPSKLFQNFFEWKTDNCQENTQLVVGSLLQEAQIYKSKGLLSISLHCLLDAHKLKKDPKIMDQIDQLKTEMRNKRVLT